MLPRLIQGGMGAGVSLWTLAREVALLGQLGVVSGTALDTILIRRLIGGDPGGHMRRAMKAFPFREFAARVLQRYFRPSSNLAGPEKAEEEMQSKGKARCDRQKTGSQGRYPLLALPGAKLSRGRELLLMLANFVEVLLAKEGHDGRVGVNYLHRIQFPNLPSIYGAMLAGVDAVLVGAGVPGDIPEIIDRLAEHHEAHMTLELLDAGTDRPKLSFDPAKLWNEETSDFTPPILQRPKFLAIISSVTLARALLKKAPGGIDGFIVEAPTAGGHNAPPRGPMQLSHEGEPIYGPRDEVDLSELAALGIPFWLAGGYASRDRLNSAVAAGARGIQVGTAFAFCRESGLDPVLRRRCLQAILRSEAHVFTDPAASPTHFPFKVVVLPDTLTDEDVYSSRPRRCDLGYLRRAYRKPDGTIGYRCPAEPLDEFVQKGGDPGDTVGRKCLCNALLANIGLGQRQPEGFEEPPLITAGDDLSCVRKLISSESLDYRARDVVEMLL